MIEDKIQLILKDINKIKEDLKGIKKDIKFEEKLDTPEYLDLKKALDDLKKQKKDVEETYMRELETDSNYQKLREMRLQKEEALAEQNEKLFKVIAELPPKPFDMNMETEEGPVKVQIVPDMRLFLNGREEKKRAA